MIACVSLRLSIRNPCALRSSRNAVSACFRESSATVQRRFEIALDEHGDGALAEADRQLLVGLPERVHEFVGTDDETVQSRTDVEEQCLDERGIGSEEERLQALVELASIEPAGDDAADERPVLGAREQHEDLAADQREQRTQRLLVVELHRACALARTEELAHFSSKGMRQRLRLARRGSTVGTTATPIAR